MPKHITKEQKEQIVAFYKEKPTTIKEVADKFKISQPSVIKVLNEYKIKRYNKVQLFSPDLDENYFSNIDNEYKAYFLGLIITDGCIHMTKGRQPLVSISLQEKDKYIIEKFKEEIHSNKTVTSDGRGCSELSILSTKMVNDLKKYGINERKSLNTIFPSNLDISLYPHLIRGIIDGDGSVAFYARPGRKIHNRAIRLCQGNEKFLQDIIDFLYQNCEIDKINIRKEKDSLWSMAYSNKNSLLKLIPYLYKDANIYLVRKKHLCDLILEEITPR